MNVATQDALNLITLDEAAQVARCSRDAIRARVWRGQLTGHRFGARGRMLVDRDELLTLLQRAGVH